MNKGRPELPKEVKENRGTFQKSRETKMADIKPISKLPYAPKWVCERGKEIWREVGNILIEKGLLVEGETHVFARICHFWGTSETLFEEIEKEGYTTILSNNVEAPNPKYKIAMEMSKEGDKLAAQFGLTPATRKMVPAKPQDEVDPIEAMRNKKSA